MLARSGRSVVDPGNVWFANVFLKNRRRDGREVPNSAVEQKNRKDNNFQLVSHWVFSMSFKMTKVKLLFLYRFSVLSVHLHYKPLSRDGGRVRPHFYVLGWTENCRGDVFAFEDSLAERGRARAHYIGFKVLEKITEHYWWQKGILWGSRGGMVSEEWMGARLVTLVG